MQRGSVNGHINTSETHAENIRTLRERRENEAKRERLRSSTYTGKTTNVAGSFEGHSEEDTYTLPPFFHTTATSPRLPSSMVDSGIEPIVPHNSDDQLERLRWQLEQLLTEIEPGLDDEENDATNPNNFDSTIRESLNSSNLVEFSDGVTFQKTPKRMKMRILSRMRKFILVMRNIFHILIRLSAPFFNSHVGCCLICS